MASKWGYNTRQPTRKFSRYVKFRTKWRRGKVHNRKGHGRGRWMYPNGKKKGRRWKKV